MLVEGLPMIGKDNNDGLVENAKVSKFDHKFPEAVVREPDRRVIDVNEGLY